MTRLDAIDRSLLRILQKNNRLSNLQLARRARVSSTTCLRRVRRLRQLGVIVADVCLLDPVKAGVGLFVFIDVTLARVGEELQQAFESRMAQAPEVTQCYRVSDQMDYTLMVQVANMEAYHRFVRRVLTDAPGVHSFKSTFAMRRSKFRTDVGVSFDA